MSNIRLSASKDARNYPQYPTITALQKQQVVAAMHNLVRYLPINSYRASMRFHKTLRKRYGYTCLKTMPEAVFFSVLNDLKRLEKHAYFFWLANNAAERQFRDMLEADLVRSEVEV